MVDFYSLTNLPQTANVYLYKVTKNIYYRTKILQKILIEFRDTNYALCKMTHTIRNIGVKSVNKMTVTRGRSDKK